MSILDPKAIKAAIAGLISEQELREERQHDWNSPSARKQKATDIEQLLNENITSDVLHLLTLKDQTLAYNYPIAGQSALSAKFTVWGDGLRHSHVKGSWWNSLASPRQVAEKLVEHGQNGVTLGCKRSFRAC